MTYTRSQRHAPKYYLSHWLELQKNISELSGFRLNQAKILFSSLKLLTDEEKQYLAYKYYTPRVKAENGGRIPKPDEQIAGELGVSKQEYADKRREIEYKLIPIIIENKKKFPFNDDML